jgi:hypothetical protein
MKVSHDAFTLSSGSLSQHCLDSILEALGSNLGWGIGYPDRCFLGFPQSLQANARIVCRLDHRCFLSNPLHYEYVVQILATLKIQITKFRVLSSRTNFTDRATASCRLN